MVHSRFKNIEELKLNMKKALLYIDINEKNDRDIYEPTNYFNLKGHYRRLPSNSGNKLWLSAVEQYILQDEIEYEYLTEELTEEYINERYEYILFPTANLLDPRSEGLDLLEKYASSFEKIKIPIFVIGIGAQAMSYEDIDTISKKLVGSGTRFIKSVYETGGQFGVRGYFTKEVLDRLGFRDAKVIGCPSMYSMGRNLKITNTKTDVTDFRTVINGDTNLLASKYISDVFDKYKNTTYIDQETFSELLYDSFVEEKLLPLNSFGLLELVSRYSEEGLRLFAQDKVKLFYDIPIWKKYLVENNFSFSFGKRIHGNIISILCGIPAHIVCIDSRVREMAEFYNIPHSLNIEEDIDLYNLYLKTDYTEFNRTFESKYDNFKLFFEENGIANNIDDASAYLRKIESINYESPQYRNKMLKQEILQQLSKTGFTKVNIKLGKIMFKLKQYM